jgi:hypothetical protein
MMSERGRKQSCTFLLTGTLLMIAFIGISLASRFLGDRPVRYADDQDHFKYGSLGGELNKRSADRIPSVGLMP